MSDIGVILHKQGRLSEAREITEDALQSRSRILAVPSQQMWVNPGFSA
jgi:hypothetical protein